MPQVFKRAATRSDLVDHYIYLAENAGEEAAGRFLGAPISRCCARSATVRCGLQSLFQRRFEAWGGSYVRTVIL
jgi:hypothetical protein